VGPSKGHPSISELLHASVPRYSPESAVRFFDMFVLMGQQTTHTPSQAEKNLEDRTARIQRLIAREKLATPQEKGLTLP